MDYTDLGYDDRFEKGTRQNIPLEAFPQIPEVMFDNILQEVSGNKIAGGKFTSKNGKLTIDLEEGKFTYNNGTTDVVEIGGEDDTVSITEST
jgi:hypothetical protein